MDKMDTVTKLDLVLTKQRLRMFFASPNEQLYQLLDIIGVQNFSRFASRGEVEDINL